MQSWSRCKSSLREVEHMRGPSLQMIEDVRLAARVYGKSSSITATKDTRCILPLPSVLQVIDCMLALMVHSTLNSLPTPPPSFWFGGVPGTQCMDISWTIQMSTERTLDSKSAGAVAAADVARYYDSIPLL